MERSLTLELVRVTEAAALAAARWMGLGKKDEADDAATTAMRREFQHVPMDGVVVIGEGEMDEAPMLYIGEQVGSGNGPEVDVAVDPLEGTEIVAKGLNNALSVIAIAPKGNLLHAPDIYMEKLAAGPALKGVIRLDDPVGTTIAKASAALNKSVRDLTVMVLERERHKDLIAELRSIGVRIKLLAAGDVAGAIATAFDESGIDLYMGSGGAPEGVLAAAALSCLGGEFQGRLMISNEEERERCQKMGLKDPEGVLKIRDLVGDEDIIFAATGVTPGDFLGGVRYLPGQRAETHSMVMRAKTRTIRYIKSLHYLPNKPFLRNIE